LTEADEIVSRRFLAYDPDRPLHGAAPRRNCELEPNLPGETIVVTRAASDDDSAADARDDSAARNRELVVLGRAFAVSRDEKYADAALRLLENVIGESPPDSVVSRPSSWELSLRLIHWVWTLELIGGSAALLRERIERLLPVAYRDLAEQSRNGRRRASFGVEQLTEAAALFIGGSYFRCLKHSARWRNQGHERLSQGILQRTFDDGGSVERTVGYHLFALTIFVLAGLTARNTRMDFSREYWSRLERMFEYLALLGEGGDVPLAADANRGCIVDLGGGEDPVSAWLSVGAILFNRSDFKAEAGHLGEPALWLLCRAGRDRFAQIANHVHSPIRSKSLSYSGYYLLQRGRRKTTDRLSAILDCGPHGNGSDDHHVSEGAMSLTLRIGGSDILVDPDEQDSPLRPRSSDGDRVTRHRNVLIASSANRCSREGSDRRRRWNDVRCVRWAPNDSGGLVVAELRGLAPDDNPVFHRRAVELKGESPTILAVDELIFRGRHDAELFWHFSEQCRITALGEGRFEVEFGGESILLALDPRLHVNIVQREETPSGRRVDRSRPKPPPGLTVIGSCVFHDELTLVTRMDVLSESHARRVRETTRSEFRRESEYERTGLEVPHSIPPRIAGE